MDARRHGRMHVRTRAGMYACMRVCITNACMRACMHVCVHMFVASRVVEVLELSVTLGGFTLGTSGRFRHSWRSDLGSLCASAPSPNFNDHRWPQWKAVS